MVKKYLLACLSIFLTLCFLGCAIYLIYLTSTINWLLSIVVSFICIILVAVLAWYSVKAFYMIKVDKRNIDAYNRDTYHSSLPSFEEAYFDKYFSSGEYKKVVEKREYATYNMYLKLNEASPLFNCIVIYIDQIKEPIEFNNDIDKAMLVHDVPNGLFKTVVIIVSSKPGKGLPNLYILNNSYNLGHQKYYCVLDTPKKEIYLGEDSEFTSTDFVMNSRSFISSVLSTRGDKDAI